MVQPDANPPASLPASPRFLPLLLALFVGSGCAALIYEVVWLQLLQLVIGSTAVSLGVLLGTFMGGMCLGSLALPRLAPRQWHPLRLYAGLELGIGLFGLAILFGMPYVEGLYAAFGHGTPGITVAWLLSAICLLPPTLLMGATLPAIARWVETTPEAFRGWGSSTGATSPGPCAAVCWPGSICFEFTTWRWRPTSPWASARPWPCWPLGPLRHALRGIERRQARPGFPATLSPSLRACRRPSRGGVRRDRLCPGCAHWVRR